MAVQPPIRTAEQMFSRLAEVLDDAIETIEVAPDPQQALEAAVKLFDLLKAYKGRAAALRAGAALRIKEAESLSLVTLAGRLGVSKARAEQLVNDARKGD